MAVQEPGRDVMSDSERPDRILIEGPDCVRNRSGHGGRSLRRDRRRAATGRQMVYPATESALRADLSEPDQQSNEISKRDRGPQNRRPNHRRESRLDDGSLREVFWGAYSGPVIHSARSCGGRTERPCLLEISEG